MGGRLLPGAEGGWTPLQIASKFQRQIRDFRWRRARETISQMITTTIDYQILQDSRAKRPYCCFRLSVVVAIAWDQFLCAGRGPKPRICRWNCHPISHSSIDISISVLVAISSFPVVFRCHSHFLTLSASSPWLKNPGLPSEL